MTEIRECMQCGKKFEVPNDDDPNIFCQPSCRNEYEGIDLDYRPGPEKTAREFGRAYGRWCSEDNPSVANPVNVDEMVNSTQDIPDEDYIEMKAAGIEPNAREYWEGFNSALAD